MRQEIYAIYSYNWSSKSNFYHKISQLSVRIHVHPVHAGRASHAHAHVDVRKSPPSLSRLKPRPAFYLVLYRKITPETAGRRRMRVSAVAVARAPLAGHPACCGAKAA